MNHTAKFLKNFLIDIIRSDAEGVSIGELDEISGFPSQEVVWF